MNVNKMKSMAIAALLLTSAPFAQASLVCPALDPHGLGQLEITTQDSTAQVAAQLGRASYLFSGPYALKSGGMTGSVHEAQLTEKSGAKALLQVTYLRRFTRGGGLHFCGRAGCPDPVPGPSPYIISAQLQFMNQTLNFTCHEN